MKTSIKGDVEKLGHLQIHWRNAYENLALKSQMLPLFTYMDKEKKSNWPPSFKKFLEKKTSSKKKEKDHTRKQKGKKTTADFAAANEEKLAFANTVYNRAIESKKIINNFLNPMWTEDFGSGGNMEGHLLMMRKEYYKSDFVSKTADNRVNSTVRDLKKKESNRSESKYNVTKDSTQKEIDEEIVRVAESMIDEWDVNWYPNCWLAFILFGKPCLCTDVPYVTLISGIPNNTKVASGIDVLSALNTELAPSSLRHEENTKKHGKKGKSTESMQATEPKKLQIEFVAPQQAASTEMQRLTEMLRMIDEREIVSDEESGFKASEKKKEIAKRKFALLEV